MSETQPPPPSAEDPYDQLPYPSLVHSQSHPDRLFVNATLFGMSPAPVAQARVLELGCGDASNLIAIAHAHPDSQCVGVDTSGKAIADGRALAEEVGVNNLSLLQSDLAQITPDFGEFDYIIAHGLYSWVPPDVRERLMEICLANLAPGGVAYVSYSAYPGAYFRQLVRGLEQYHVRQFTDPAEKARQARGLLQFLAGSGSLPPTGPGQRPAPAGRVQIYAERRNELYRGILKNELDHVANTALAMTLHDDLAPHNHPVFFHQFEAHAKGHGLQYLSEADFSETQPPVPGAPVTLPPEVVRVLEQVPHWDVVAREQYADFVKCRQFRQTLLCRADVTVSRPAVRERVKGLYAACIAQPAAGGPPLSTRAPQEFHLENRGTFTVDQPVAKAALTELGAVWPRRLPFAELAERVRGRLGDAGTSVADANPGIPADTTEALAQLLLTGYAANILSLHAYAPEMATTAGERPKASPLARAQIARRETVSNLNGASVDLSGPVGGRLLKLLDGTRDRDALAADLAVACLQGGQTRARDGVPITNPGEMASILRGEMDMHLETMARLALLVE
jgi:SAM-dependent methyltransferase